MTRYEVFITVIECGSFTKAAQELNYTQSAVSQMVHTLEEELATTLIVRTKTGITLTEDGREYLPYLHSISNAHRELHVKSDEMQGLKNGKIRIGTFTSVSCNWLPKLMKDFKKEYPSVRFFLQQGDYTNITQWIREGNIDLGFVNADAVEGICMVPLQTDFMVAVLPKNHPLTKQKSISLQQLVSEPYILLDEGAYSVPLHAFESAGLKPNIQYKVYDDYSILSMVEQGLGVSLLYEMVVKNWNRNLTVRPLTEPVNRTIALACKNRKTLSIASKNFMDFVINSRKKTDSFL